MEQASATWFLFPDHRSLDIKNQIQLQPRVFGLKSAGIAIVNLRLRLQALRTVIGQELAEASAAVGELMKF
jgi:hypothetical protein